MLLEDLKTHAQTGILYRDGTFDMYIVKESAGYFPLGLKPDDVVLDIGGHVGTFASRCVNECPQVAENIVSYEAESTNAEVLAFNATKFGFNSYNTAVVDDSYEGDSIDVWRNPGKNNAMHATAKRRGRTDSHPVGVMRLGQLVDAVLPTVVKCDIEGGEYAFNWPVVLALPGAAKIRKIVIEYHLGTKNGKKRAAEIHEQIIAAGFAVTKAPNFIGAAWATLGFYDRAV